MQLSVTGPFGWLPSSDYFLPRVFDVPEGRARGVYLFTVPADTGQLIYWVGQTTQPFQTRLRDHVRQYFAGTYSVLDPDGLAKCQRVVLWKGMWFRKDAADRFEEYLDAAGNIAAHTRRLLQASQIFLMPAQKDKRLLARIEGAIVNCLYADSTVGHILDRGYHVAPRWENEEPLETLRVDGPDFLGLPRDLSV